MGPSVYRVTSCLFVFLFVMVELGELHRARVEVLSNLVSSVKGPSSVLSQFVDLVCLFVLNVRSGLILDKSIYNNFCVGTSMRNSTT